MAAKLKSSSSNNQSSNNRAMQQQQQQQQQPPTSASGGSGKRSKEMMAEDPFMKLFSVQEGGSPSSAGKGNRGGKQHQSHASPSSGPQDDFTRWCFEKVQTIGGSVDIPTFVAFLKEVESPYEVGDYVRSYLGDGKEAREFSREFLERRSRWKNARKDGGGSFEDNLCRPASAINPSSNDFQEVKVRK
jgi:PERQ amino acid-rich with GYF domain-containing protein